MKNRWPTVGKLLVMVLLLGACTGAEGAGRRGVMKGNLAHDFRLQALDGGEVSLGDYAGSVVLVNFWAAWCPPCRAEIPDLEAAHRAHGEEGLVVLGINVEDPPHMVESFVAEVDITYPVLLDESGRVMKEYRAPGLPMSLIVDRDGVIRVRHVGYLSAEQLAQYLDQVLP